MHHSRPGEMRSFTLSMFASVILSPTATSARAAGASTAPVTASAAASLRVLVIGRPSLDDPRPCLGSESEASVSRSVDRAKAVPRPAKGAATTDDDRRDEAHLVRVFDRGGALEGLLLEAHVVEPYLPQLARAVVDVRVRDHPRLLVDEDHALAVGVLRQLGDALDHVDPALLPLLVEG